MEALWRERLERATSVNNAKWTRMMTVSKTRQASAAEGAKAQVGECEAEMARMRRKLQGFGVPADAYTPSKAPREGTADAGTADAGTADAGTADAALLPLPGSAMSAASMLVSPDAPHSGNDALDGAPSGSASPTTGAASSSATRPAAL